MSERAGNSNMLRDWRVAQGYSQAQPSLEWVIHRENCMNNETPKTDIHELGKSGSKLNTNERNSYKRNGQIYSVSTSN